MDKVYKMVQDTLLMVPKQQLYIQICAILMCDIYSPQSKTLQVGKKCCDWSVACLHIYKQSAPDLIIIEWSLLGNGHLMLMGEQNVTCEANCFCIPEKQTCFRKNYAKYSYNSLVKKNFFLQNIRHKLFSPILLSPFPP